MATLDDEQRREVWANWNRKLGELRLQTGANKWDVLEAVGEIDAYLEVTGIADDATTLDGESAAVAKSAGDEIVSSRKGAMAELVPERSRAALGDEAHGLLVGLVMQARDHAFFPKVDEPADDSAALKRGG